MDNNELEEKLIHAMQLIRKGISHEEKLDFVGIDQINELLGQGFRLSTRAKSKEQGILNLLKVPEYKFNSWLLKQPATDQDTFNNICIMQKNRRKEDLIEILEETAEQFDDLIGSFQHSEEYEHESEANMLDKKAKACSNLLKQLVDIEKADKDTMRDDRPEGSSVEIHVHTTEQQLQRLKDLKNGKISP